MRCMQLIVAFVFVLLAGEGLQAEILITEIMYNPASRENIPAQTEWLEIYNTGKETVSLDGWYLADEDGQTERFPEKLKIKSKEAIVFIPGHQTVDDFRAAWPGKFKVVAIEKWNKGGMKGLANSPSDINEILRLYNATGRVVDEVNYDDTKPWPSDAKQGPSIYLLPNKLGADKNDHGENWARSEAGKHGGRHNKITQDYNKKDTGSPGVVKAKKRKKRKR